MYNQKLDKLISEASAKGFELKDGRFVNKTYEETDATIVLEVYYRYEGDYEDYGNFWFGRKFIELKDIDENKLIIRNEEDFVNFLEGNDDIPVVIFEKLNRNCWEFSDEYGNKLQILDNSSLKGYSSNLDYENKNGYKEKIISEIYFHDDDFDSYFSIFKTDKKTAERLKLYDVEESFKKYLRHNGSRL